MLKPKTTPENLPPIVRPSLSQTGLDMVLFFGAYACIAGILAMLIQFRG